jgi:hypothetical protein
MSKRFFGIFIIYLCTIGVFLTLLFVLSNQTQNSQANKFVQVTTLSDPVIASTALSLRFYGVSSSIESFDDPLVPQYPKLDFVYKAHQ